MSNNKEGKTQPPFSKKNDTSGWIGFASVSGLGVTMAISVVGCFLFGRFLDNRFGTSPRLLIVFTLIGVVAAYKLIFDYAIK